MSPRGWFRLIRTILRRASASAWDPLGNGRLGVRASYGLFVEDHRTDPWIYPAVNQPFVIRKLIFNPVSLSDPYQGQENPFPYVYTPADCAFQPADEPVYGRRADDPQSVRAPSQLHRREGTAGKHWWSKWDMPENWRTIFFA